MDKKIRKRIIDLTNEFKNSDLIESDEILESLMYFQELKWNDDKYYYDKKEALKFVNFSKKLTLDKGLKGAKVVLLVFQFEICTDILCVKRRKDNLRRFRESHINIPRKNGKSFIIAIIISYMYFFRTEYGAEYIITANTTKQATLLYNSIKHFIVNSPLKKKCKITDSQKVIYRKDENSYLRVLSSDAKNADSYADLVFCMDEIHEAPDQKLYDKLKTGQGIFNEPLGITITTASSGENPLNLEQELYNYSKAIENGDEVDDSFYYAIFEAKHNCKLDDESQWYESNPALGKFRKYDDLASFAKRAMKSRLRESAFRRLFLNQHVSTEIHGAIDMMLWNEALVNYKYENIKHLPNWCGLDLSSSQDITAIVQVFYDDERDKYIVYPHLFHPKDTILDREDRDKVPYNAWTKDKFMIALEGNYINYNQLHDYILSIENVQQILFDRWGSPSTQSALEENFDLIPFGQGFRDMTPTIKEFENLLIDRRIEIVRNDAFTWMAKNVTAVVDDPGNIKYSKSKSKNKIDGIIAMVMGIHGATISANTKSFDINKSVNDYFEMLGIK
ncbi:terminase large subunit [Paraclostridium bifermentans]|uniref:terminase large subunit n=1 Tax=Paraclostridium bifermentans TaxID=1490 RepID=UPI0022E4E9B6|nr:terminase TerL endonuclease subunit [Paraclostridium bifermentans]